MEGVLLNALGGSRPLRRTRPPMKLSDLDNRVLHLQVNAIENSTVKGMLQELMTISLSACLITFPLNPLPKP